jgi:isoleucyl-tRNA synthetase
VPGWDCHGLPIEWKIEEQYRAKGKEKPSFKDGASMNEFRQECRAFAQHWITVQARGVPAARRHRRFRQPVHDDEFPRRGADRRELLKFAMSDQLYRGSKPVMWSVVERTALAEAEIEYQDYESDTIWVKFPVRSAHYDPDDKSIRDLMDASVVIWTTTPWTIPGNRAVAYAPKIAYGLYEVTAAENDFGPRPGEKLIFAENLADDAFAKAKLQFKKLRSLSTQELPGHAFSSVEGLGWWL